MTGQTLGAGAQRWWRSLSALLILLLSISETSATERIDRRMILACFRVDVDGVVRALRNGANVNARYGDEDFEFIDPWSGANVSFGGEDWTGLMALCAASEFPNPPGEAEVWRDEARALALQKAIPKAEIEARRTAAIAIMQILLSHGCKLQAEDCVGATALHFAVDYQKVDLVRLLLEHGADPNVKHGIYIDGPGDLTPLHLVTDSQTIVQLLLDHGANPLVKDTHGRTAAESVALSGAIEIVRAGEKWTARPKGAVESGR